MNARKIWVAVVVLVAAAVLAWLLVWAAGCRCEMGRCANNPAATCETNADCGVFLR